MNYYVYILESENNDWYYVGMTQDVNARLQRHNSGRVRSTKRYAPFKLLWTEEFPDRLSARRREKYYKTGFGKKVWMKKVKEGRKLS
ncbi:MAG: GIY-YIG nuclease family protein [FCB group bacterium]|nr:GIY-YIG nuclease family protein [FCB group bacterium]